VKKVANQRAVKPAEVALAWLLSKPAVTAPIVGATRLEHLEDAIRSVELELSSEEIAAVEAPYRAHPVKGLGPARFPLRGRR
jgi:aryl-alcohol dehydrogenase-like predicted oxidoreductase